MTLGFWERPPTQSYLENSLINSLKLTQIGHFSTGGDTLTAAAETESYAAAERNVEASFGDRAWRVTYFF